LHQRLHDLSIPLHYPIKTAEQRERVKTSLALLRSRQVRPEAGAAIRESFLEPHLESAVQSWRDHTDRLRARLQKLGAFIDDTEAEMAT